MPQIEKILKEALLDTDMAEALAQDVLGQMKEGMTLQDAMGLNDASLEEVYALAYGFYDQGKYKEAVSLFHLLAGASPSTFKYVFGFASCLHQMEIYGDASVGFLVAGTLEPDNPIPAYYALDAFLKMNLLEEAEASAKDVIEICGSKGEFQNLKKRCELILSSIKGKKYVK